MLKTYAAIMRRGFCLGLAVLAIICLMSTSARATDQDDITIGLRTIPMLDNTIQEPITLALIFDPQNLESKSDAEEMRASINRGITTSGGTRIIPLMVPASDLSPLANIKIAFIAQGTQAYFDAISSAASASSVLTISSDLTCVRGNKCVLGIVSKPVIEIYYSRPASETTKLNFDPAFTMLIKKV